MNSTTLIECLRFRAQERPDALYSRYLFPDRAPAEMTFAETERRARQFASVYDRLGVSKGDVVLVILPHCGDLMTSFLGAMWLGAIPAFLPSLTPKLDPQRYYRTLSALLDTTEPRAIVTTSELGDSLAALTRDEQRNLTLIICDDVSASEAPHLEPPVQDPEDIALIQYSSGTTGMQKGAALSHRAILAEIEGVGGFFELNENDSFVTWVPLYHDWGLVCVALHALQLGVHFTLISPMHWVAKPVVAFEAATRYRPTVYYHPNFAFNYMTRRIQRQEMDGLDLSSLRICCNGAEPCFYDSHKMFADRFAEWGFASQSLSIVYGMAEVTNSVFAAGHREPIQVDVIDRDVLQREHRAQPVAGDGPDVLRMLGVGRPLKGTEFRILDEHKHQLPERRVGEVEIRSTAIYHGYYRNLDATKKADNQGAYLTGDLGYRVGNTLFVTGRKSDLIIVGGVNIYPHDVENVVGEHPSVVTGRVAAIGVRDAGLGTEKLIVIAESRSTDANVRADIAAYVRREVPMRLGVDVAEIYHAPYKWLIKTSSGKIARIPNYQRLSELTSRAG